MKLEFEVPELACIDTLYVQFNSRFTVPIYPAKAVEVRPSPAPNDRVEAENAAVFIVTRSDIQAAAPSHDPIATCAVPVKIPPGAVHATIQGILGNILIRNEDTYFMPDDYVAIVGEGQSVTVEFTLHSSRGAAKLLFDLDVSCGPSEPTATDPNPTGSSISIGVGPVTVNEVDSDDVLTIIAAELGIAQGLLENEVNGQLSEMRDSLGEIVRNLPLCPNIAFKRREPGEPSPSVEILGVSIYPPSLVIDGIPDLTQLGLPPVTLCQ